jgi:H/ACA ribonucleoprotein complex subunit 4
MAEEIKEKTHMLPCDVKRKRLIKTEANTNPSYGKKPEERRVGEILKNGIINLDKPSGPTSHQVDAWLKKIFNLDKVGHGGTLDPNATGVLPIGLQDATKALQALLPAGKEYVGIMRFHNDFKIDDLKKVSKNFVGKIDQLPPVRSAVKRRKRKREIYYLDLLEFKGRDVLFKVGCESGTYVRTLCVDIGKKMGVKAHLSELRRSRVGFMNEVDSVTLQDVKDSYIFWENDGDQDMIKKIIFPLEKALEGLPKIVIRDSAVDAICHGANLAVPGLVELDEGIKKEDIIAVLTLKGEGVALGKSMMSSKDMIDKDTGICCKTERVLMKKGTYPSIWKKS